MSKLMLHFGLGAFHRAHQATYTQDLNDLTDEDWRIEPVCMRNPEPAKALNAQDGQFSVVIQAPEGPQVQRISCMGQAWVLPDDSEKIIDRIADIDTHIVTITVTEKGYCAGADGNVDWSREEIKHDLQTTGSCRSLLGILCAGLARRQAAAQSGLTILSCDNLPTNGAVTRKLVAQFAEKKNPSVARWIDTHCTFPSAMVDRITPASTAKTFQIVRDAYEIDDLLAVETEPFRQWVIEDNFAAARPSWDKAGARFVKDVMPFEHMKLRMLNGSHSFIAYSGALLGIESVRDFMQDPKLAAVARQQMLSAAQSLEEIEGFSFLTFADDLVARFENPTIVHRCMQIANDGSQKMPQRIFSTALDLNKRGLTFDSCALATAIWLRFLEGADEAGNTFAINDPLAETLQKTAIASVAQPSVVHDTIPQMLGDTAAALWQIPDWSKSVDRFLQSIRNKGLRSTLAAVYPT